MVEVATPLADFDMLSADQARMLLHPVCASDAWLDAVIGGRPYRTLPRLLARSDAVVATLDASNISQALASHARIGERAGGADIESAWSREEQAGAITAGDDLAAALHRGNLEYEQRFGHVFLMCATGRTPQQMLAAMYERMDNDPDVEQQVLLRELAAVIRLRIVRLLR
jgi:2-oxo-4-hydroxy-4-carboxy-5-ureidoimidazoline decarboxylase